jgi:hypothetical protein
MSGRCTRRSARTAAAALIAAAISAAPANARPALESPGAPATQTRPAAPTVIQPIDDGFEWDSAAIGAGGATALLLLTGAGTLTLARRHRDVTSIR